MIEKVHMPRLGERIEKGKIVGWLKEAGDKVEEGEILFEVESDKATLEVESSFTGYLRMILHDEGDDVKVDEVIAVMTSTPDEPIDA